MSQEREKICSTCKHLPSIHHLEYPSCEQPCFPITDQEWKDLGVTRDDVPTVESVRKLMEMSIQPYCLRLMLKEHPVEWWTFHLSGGANGHL
jgi:hypothetical protein